VLGVSTRVLKEPCQVSPDSTSRCSDGEYGELGCNRVSAALDRVELNRTGGGLTCVFHGD